MFNPRFSWPVLACALVLWAAPGWAGVVISTSSDPSVTLDQQLDGLLGRARPDVKTRRGNSLSRFFAPPKAGRAIGITPRYTRRFLAGLPRATGGNEWSCLTKALYFEARGESVKGIFAVAEVILNRVDSRVFPSSVCRVVNQGTGRKYQCQFTFTCDGVSEKVREPRAWRRVAKVARLMLDGAARPLTHGATHYHTSAVNPRWSRVFAHTATIGTHRFYRQG